MKLYAFRFGRSSAPADSYVEWAIESTQDLRAREYAWIDGITRAVAPHSRRDSVWYFAVEAVARGISDHEVRLDGAAFQFMDYIIAGGAALRLD